MIHSQSTLAGVGPNCIAVLQRIFPCKDMQQEIEVTDEEHLIAIDKTQVNPSGCVTHAGDHCWQQRKEAGSWGCGSYKLHSLKHTEASLSYPRAYYPQCGLSQANLTALAVYPSLLNDSFCWRVSLSLLGLPVYLAPRSEKPLKPSLWVATSMPGKVLSIAGISDYGGFAKWRQQGTEKEAGKLPGSVKVRYVLYMRLTWLEANSLNDRLF